MDHVKAAGYSDFIASRVEDSSQNNHNDNFRVHQVSRIRVQSASSALWYGEEDHVAPVLLLAVLLHCIQPLQLRTVIFIISPNHAAVSVGRLSSHFEPDQAPTQPRGHAM